MRRIILTLVLLMAVSQCVWAESVTVSWTPNSENDLVGYKIYYGPQSRVYDEMIDVGMPGWNDQGREEYIVDVIPSGRYYFTVTAYDQSGNESGFGNESSVTYSDEPPLPQDDLLPPVITMVEVRTNGLSFNITWKSPTVGADKFQVFWSDTPDRWRWRKTMYEGNVSSSGQYYTKTIGSSEMIEGHRYYFAMTAIRGIETSAFSDIIEKVFGATEPPPIISGQYIIWMSEQIMDGDSGEVVLKFKKVEQD